MKTVLSIVTTALALMLMPSLPFAQLYARAPDVTPRYSPGDALTRVLGCEDGES